MDNRKKKRAEKAHRQHQKEKEIARQVRAEENRSDVEVELKSKEPTEMGDDASSSKNEGGREVVTTLVECHEPMAASIHGGRDAEEQARTPASLGLVPVRYPQ